MEIKTITSVHNQRVKDAVKLRDHRQRGRQGRFVIDGAREILRALAGRVKLVELFVCEPLCKSADSLRVLASMHNSGIETWHVAPEVFEKLAFGDRHEGVLAVGETPRLALDEVNVPAGSLIAVVESLEKPGNLGAVVRTADGAGVAAVIAADARTDFYNPNCIRASLGTVFTRAVCRATTSQTLTWLRGRGCKIFAARLDATIAYTDVDYRGDAAIVLGSEAGGLSDTWHAADVIAIKLPMLGAADSLNISTTAAVLFYEALRQRMKCV
jgi:RNA methyltransferase, TrmH family